MKSRRLAEMESYILARGSVTMEELCAHFGVSMNTVRRDVAELRKNPGIRKVYGGVRAENGRPALVPYEERARTANANKRLIGRRAAGLVHDGDIIFVDSGTTTMHIMEELRGKDITLITNNIEVILQALACESIRMIVLPGEVHRKTNSITGDESAAFLSRFNTNIAFMAATGVSFTGVTNSSPLEYSIKKAAVSHTEKAVLLVTGEKFGVTSLLSYAELGRFSAVITDGRIPAEYREKLLEDGIGLEIVDEAD